LYRFVKLKKITEQAHGEQRLNRPEFE